MYLRRAVHLAARRLRFAVGGPNGPVKVIVLRDIALDYGDMRATNTDRNRRARAREAFADATEAGDAAV